MIPQSGASNRDQSALRFSRERHDRHRLVTVVALVGKRGLAQYTPIAHPSNLKDLTEMRIARNCPLPGPETERSGVPR